MLKTITTKNKLGNFWVKSHYSINGDLIYYENSDGYIIDNRVKTKYTLDEIANKLGIPIGELKINNENNLVVWI